MSDDVTPLSTYGWLAGILTLKASSPASTLDLSLSSRFQLPARIRILFFTVGLNMYLRLYRKCPRHVANNDFKSDGPLTCLLGQPYHDFPARAAEVRVVVFRCFKCLAVSALHFDFKNRRSVAVSS